MRLNTVLLVAPLALGLAACGSRDNGESAEDYAAQLGNVKPGDRNPALANLPKVATRGRDAVRYSAPYSGFGFNGAKSNLQILSNGYFQLQESGKTVKGTYDWLPDGKRLRLNGVGFRPIVVIAENGALYRVTNENVPLDDLTPDRMYSSQ